MKKMGIRVARKGVVKENLIAGQCFVLFCFVSSLAVRERKKAMSKFTRVLVLWAENLGSTFF